MADLRGLAAGFPEVILQLLPNLACVLGECGKVRRRPRQKVNVPTTDKHGFPLSQTEVSRLRRYVSLMAFHS